MRMSRFLATVIVTGIVLRLAIAALFSFPYDFHSWALIISNFEAGNGLYDVAGFNYAPPWGYVLGLFSQFAELAGVDVLGVFSTEFLFMEESSWSPTAFVTSEAFNVAFEFVLLAFDLVMSCMLYGIVMERRSDERMAEKTFALWFLCPFVLAVTCIGGMFDGLSAITAVLSMALAVRRRFFLSGSMIACAALLKLFPAFLVFVLVGYVVCSYPDRRQARAHILKAVAGAVLTVVVLLLPQIMDGTLPYCFSFISSRADGGMGNGFGMLMSTAVIAVYLAILVLSFLIGRYMARYKGEDRERKFFMMMSLNVAVLFICPANPQYILLLAPFLILLMVFDGNRGYSKAYLLLCIGATMSVCTSIVPSLESFSLFTGFMDPDWLVSAIGMWTAEWHGISLASILWIGGVIQYIATTLVIYTFWKGEFGGAVLSVRHRVRAGTL